MAYLGIEPLVRALLKVVSSAFRGFLTASQLEITPTVVHGLGSLPWYYVPVTVCTSTASYFQHLYRLRLKEFPANGTLALELYTALRT